MHCTQCGHQYQESDNFCAKCGQALIDEVKQSTNITYEHCEITWEILKEPNSSLIFGLFQGFEGEARFWAKSIGEKGVYCVARSTIFKNDKYFHTTNFSTTMTSPEADVDDHIDAHNDIVAKLIADGWHPTGERGEYWWEHRFKREVKTS